MLRLLILDLLELLLVALTIPLRRARQRLRGLVRVVVEERDRRHCGSGRRHESKHVITADDCTDADDWTDDCTDADAAPCTCW